MSFFILFYQKHHFGMKDILKILKYVDPAKKKNFSRISSYTYCSQRCTEVRQCNFFLFAGGADFISISIYENDGSTYLKSYFCGSGNCTEWPFGKSTLMRLFIVQVPWLWLWKPVYTILYSSGILVRTGIWKYTRGQNFNHNRYTLLHKHPCLDSQSCRRGRSKPTYYNWANFQKFLIKWIFGRNSQTLT